MTESSPRPIPPVTRARKGPLVAQLQTLVEASGSGALREPMAPAGADRELLLGLLDLLDTHAKSGATRATSDSPDSATPYPAVQAVPQGPIDRSNGTRSPI